MTSSSMLKAITYLISFIYFLTHLNMLRVRVHDTMSRESEWARRKEISNLCKRQVGNSSRLLSLSVYAELIFKFKVLRRDFAALDALLLLKNLGVSLNNVNDLQAKTKRFYVIYRTNL